MIQIRVFFSLYIVFHLKEIQFFLSHFPYIFFPSKIENHPPRWCSSSLGAKLPPVAKLHVDATATAVFGSRATPQNGTEHGGGFPGMGMDGEGVKFAVGRNQPYMVLLATSAQWCKFPRFKDIPKHSEHLMELWPLWDRKMAGIASFTSSLDRNCIAVSKPSKRRYKVRWRPVKERDPTTSLA